MEQRFLDVGAHTKTNKKNNPCHRLCKELLLWLKVQLGFTGSEQHSQPDPSPGSIPLVFFQINQMTQPETLSKFFSCKSTFGDRVHLVQNVCFDFKYTGKAFAPGRACYNLSFFWTFSRADIASPPWWAWLQVLRFPPCPPRQWLVEAGGFPAGCLVSGSSITRSVRGCLLNPVSLTPEGLWNGYSYCAAAAEVEGTVVAQCKRFNNNNNKLTCSRFCSSKNSSWPISSSCRI